MFESMTTEEIKVILDNDPELKERVSLLLEMCRLFRQLPPEKQAAAIDNIREKYPAVAEALKYKEGHDGQEKSA